MTLLFFRHRKLLSLIVRIAVCWAAVYGQNTLASGFAFTANAHDYSVSTYTVNNLSGALRHLSYTPVPKMPSAVVVHPSGEFVYVVSKTPDLIAGFRLNKRSGELTPITGSPFATQAHSPFAMAFHPSGKFAYVAARFAGVGAYRVDEQTGALDLLPGSPFKAQERTRSVVVHPSGRFVYAVNGYSNSVSAYNIDQKTGVLKELAASPFSVSEEIKIDYKALFMEDVPETAGGIPYHMALDPTGRFAYVANWADASVSVFHIDKKNGSLSAVKGSPFFSGFNPYSVSVHPSGKYIYVVQWSSGEIMVHTVDEVTGQLSPASGAPFPTGAEGPVAVVFSTDGRRAYVPHYESDDVAQFNVNTKTGALDFVERVSTRLAPWSIALASGEEGHLIKSSNKFSVSAKAGIGLIGFGNNLDLVKEKVNNESVTAAIAGHEKNSFLVVDKVSNKLTKLRINQGGGGVSPAADSSVETGKLPVDVEKDVNDWFVYVPNSESNSLSVFFLDKKTGLVKPVSNNSVPTGKRPVSVSLDPASRFLFVVNADSNNISVFKNYSGTQPLMLESKKYGSPFTAGKEPVALTVEPTGHFAYVVNAGSDTISAYRVHHHSGALSELPGSPFKAGKRPVSIVSHPGGNWLFVANEKSSDIVSYRIEKELGALDLMNEVASLSFKPKLLRLNRSGDIMYVLSMDGKVLRKYEVNVENGQLEFKKEQRLVKSVSDILINE